MPVFQDRVLSGYYVMKLNIVSLPAPPKFATVSLEELVVDEALRRLSMISSVDVAAGKQPWLMAQGIVASINQRLEAQVIVDILIKEFTFVSAKEARR
jgi:hypothetical protein